MRGAKRLRYRYSAWFKRASRTGEGLPRYSAAPKTMMASDGRASSRTDCCWISAATRFTRASNQPTAPSSARATIHFMIDLAGDKRFIHSLLYGNTDKRAKPDVEGST